MNKSTRKKAVEDEEEKGSKPSSGRKGFKGAKKLSANQRRAAAEKEAKEKWQKE